MFEEVATAGVRFAVGRHGYLLFFGMRATYCRLHRRVIGGPSPNDAVRETATGSENVNKDIVAQQASGSDTQILP